MENAIQTCPYCNKPMPTTANFCSVCGEALSLNAKELEKQHRVKAKLELLNQLIDEIDDPDSLQVLRSTIEKLK